MKYYFHTLVWEYLDMSELDRVADYEFDNGISIRISQGDAAKGNAMFPYEINVSHPVKGRIRYEYLDKTMVNDIMRELDNEVINQIIINNEKTSEF